MKRSSFVTRHTLPWLSLMVRRISCGLRLLRVWKRLRLWELFVNGLKRTTAFRKELLVIRLSSLIHSWHITSSMGLTWSIMAKALADEGYADKVTVRQAVKKKVAWARNCQLTVSGYSPLEMATGRRPPDLFDVETSTPELIPRMRTVPLWNCNALPGGLIRRPDNHWISERILLDGSCRQTVPIRKEIVCLFGTRMSPRRSPKVYGSDALSCHRKVLWCWLKFIVLCFERR